MQGTAEGMCDARAEACAACVICPIADSHPSPTVPYEIHVTVEEAEVDSFRATCAELGVKPLFLALQLASGGVFRDVMTSSVHRGDDLSAKAEARRIGRGLSAKGFRVVRSKIETVPWHPQAPSRSNGVPPGEGRYFEAHLAVRCRPEERPHLAQLAHGLGLHLSRNILKDAGGGAGIIMATARSSENVSEDFRAMAERCRDVINGEGFAVDRVIVEYALFDDREPRDSAWIGGQ